METSVDRKSRSLRIKHGDQEISTGTIEGDTLEQIICALQEAIDGLSCLPQCMGLPDVPTD